MPNFFDQWLPWTEKSKAELRNRVNAYCAGGAKKETMQSLADDCEFTNLRKWLHSNSGHEDISFDNYAKLVLVGLKGGWLGRDERPLFRGFSEFLGHPLPKGGLKHSGHKTEHFEMHRYSFLAQGYIFRGALSITHEREQITVTEMCRIQSEVAKEHGLGEDDQWFSRTGLLFPRGEESYLMISHKDAFHNEVQTAYLDRVADGVYRGPFSDWHGNNFYAARIHISRRQTALKDDEIRVVKPLEIRGAVDKYLTEDWGSGTHVVPLN
jgi:hypothetical protein